MQNQNRKTERPTLDEAARGATAMLRHLKVTVVKPEPKSTPGPLCELCGEHQVENVHAICAGCGKYVCPSCYADHKKTHHASLRSLGGQEIYVLRTRFTLPVPESTAKQTRFAFEE